MKKKRIFQKYKKPSVKISHGRMVRIRKRGKQMASSKEYLNFILEQLSGLEDITHRAMMGEYVLYYRGKVFGGIYDDRFLVKPTKSAKAMMPDADMELPYEGAKEMILVDDVDNREFLRKLVEAMYEDLPSPKKKYLGIQYPISM